jgi:hypothetical protein
MPLRVTLEINLLRSYQPIPKHPVRR